jgi:hypothetical protein
MRLVTSSLTTLRNLETKISSISILNEIRNRFTANCELQKLWKLSTLILLTSLLRSSFTSPKSECFVLLHPIELLQLGTTMEQDNDEGLETDLEFDQQQHDKIHLGV